MKEINIYYITFPQKISLQANSISEAEAEFTSWWKNMSNQPTPPILSITLSETKGILLDEPVDTNGD